ncbi:MAG TPA: VWA domain-containing protein [Aggregatilineales bacterium]|nr:VWA domain-containing protein [Aggregatilineales bacterium]
MPYTAVATSKTPALIIYLLDVSGSMGSNDVQLADGGTATRISVVLKALEDVATAMVGRSTRGTLIQPRYKVAIYAYASQVYDVLQGVKTVTEFAQMGVPTLTTMDTTNTEAAFLAAESLLQSEVANLPAGSPAPLVCHMTDGEINAGGDPAPIAERIKTLAVPDGNALIENIYIGPNLLRHPTADPKSWVGLTAAAELTTDYAKRLFEMSSPIPESYRNLMSEMGYHGLQDGARMMFAGNDEKLIEMAFAMSGVTPTK